MTNTFNFTPQSLLLIDEQIKELRSQGLSSRKIAMQLPLQEKFIRERIRVLGLPNIRTGGDFSPDQTQERRLLVAKMTRQGKTANEIAVDLKISTVTVGKYLRKLGIKAVKSYEAKSKIDVKNLDWDEYRSNPSIVNRNKLVEANIGLVRLVAHRFSKDLEFEDLVQAGTLGLIKAVERFDLTKDYKFSSYAVAVIRGTILHYLRDCHNMIKRRGEIIPVLSLDVTMSAENGNETKFVDTIPAKEQSQWEGIDVQAAIETLEPQYQEVIRLHFFEGIEQQVIARRIGVNPRIVNRRIKSALFYLKHELN